MQPMKGDCKILFKIWIGLAVRFHINCMNGLCKIYIFKSSGFSRIFYFLTKASTSPLHTPKYKYGYFSFPHSKNLHLVAEHRWTEAITTVRGTLKRDTKEPLCMHLYTPISQTLTILDMSKTKLLAGGPQSLCRLVENSFTASTSPQNVPEQIMSQFGDFVLHKQNILKNLVHIFCTRTEVKLCYNYSFMLNNVLFLNQVRP